MINKEDLVPGAWYDGFIWKAGKQQGVAAAIWLRNEYDSNNQFWVPTTEGWMNYKGEGPDGFDPNMISTAPTNGSS